MWLLEHCKTSLPAPKGTHSLEGINLMWPPWPDKAIKLLLCNSCKTVSMILLGISEQRLSFGSSVVRQRGSLVLRPVSLGRDPDNAGSHAYVSTGGIQETTVSSPQTAVN